MTTTYTTGDWTNIILAVILLIFGLRDIFVNNTAKDYSKNKYSFIRWFLSKQEKVTAIHLVRALGFETTKDFRNKIAEKKLYDYTGAIRILSECIVQAENDGSFTYGSNNRHSSKYYVDSMGFAQKKENCYDLYNVMKYLISNVNTDYDYVFSIKGGNIPLITAFSMDNNDVLSIVAKDRNEMVNSGNISDSLINYEGLRDLMKKAKNNSKDTKGIAIACNLADGSNFLDAIKLYNNKIDELKCSGILTQNIQKIKSVFILYRAIDSEELDKNYEQADLRCYRYFDLNEELKDSLFKIKNKSLKTEKYLCYECIKGRKRKCNAKFCYKSF